MSEVLAALLVLAGALFAFLGSLGLLRLPSFYERVHPPTMGTTLGAALVLAGSMLTFGSARELVIALLLLVNTPVTYTLLVRAALLRGD